MRLFFLCRRAKFHLFKQHGHLDQARKITYAAHSAIGHLVSGTPTTSWLYEDHTTRAQLEPEATNAELVRLVTEAKFGTADRLRLQLLADDFEIQHHHIYEKAAVAALHWNNLDNSLAQFSSWFTLVPDVDQAGPPVPPGPFQDIRHSLFRSGMPVQKLPIIFRFAIMSTSKGYLEPMFRETLQFVTRYSNETEGAQFLLEIERAATRYQLYRRPENVRATQKRYRAIAIEICCQAKWHVAATRIAQLDRDFVLPDRTYELLLHGLQDDTHAQRKAIVEALRSRDMAEGEKGYISQQPKFAPFVRNSVYDNQYLLNSRTSRGPLIPLSRRTASPKQTVSRNSVAIQLKAFTSSIKTGGFPKKTDLLNFLNDFKHVGGSDRSLLSLRKRAILRGGEEAIAWLTTEMLFHDRERQYDRVISLFVDNFQRTPALPPVFDYTLSRLLRTRQPQFANNSQDKLQLDHHNRWLILKSIVRLSVSLPWSLATIQALLASYLTSRSFKGSGRIFASFIWAFGECGCVNEAAHVLKAMLYAGRVPDRRHYDVLAGVCAKNGDVDRALAVLDGIENGGNGQPGAWKTKGRGGATEPVIPRLVSYGRVIQGFLDAGLLEPALAVERRLMRRFPYERGINQKLDDVLDSMWALQIERKLKR